MGIWKYFHMDTQTQTQDQNQFGSEFDSIHFGIGINKRLKCVRPKSVWL